MATAKESVKYSYDIFFSLSHLDRNSTNWVYKALVESGLRIFRDGDPIEGSGDVESDLKKAIERSKSCVVVLSKSYASSKWCLDQLVMMIEFKRNAILSLFYDQKGRIGEGFARFEDKLKLKTGCQRLENLTDKIQGWSDALSFASRLEGFDLQNQADGDESKFIQNIIEATEKKVKVVQEDFVPMEAEPEGGLLNPEPSCLVKDWIAWEINLRDIEELPVNPNYPFLQKLVLEQSHNLMEIPDSFFESLPFLEVLDLSNTSIKTLPQSIASLTKLRQFFLRNCVLLRELPPEIGKLKELKVFDLEGTELMCLPMEIIGLLQLEHLKVSLFRCADNHIERKGINAIIPRATLSKCSHLKELSILVDPDCEWWDVEVEAIINELPLLRNLGKLELYFPTLELLQKFLQLPGSVYQDLSNFRLTVGRHEQHIISSLPHNLRSVFEKLDKCLKYVNGKGSVDRIGKALKHARALFLDRQWTIEKLSAFKIDEMHQLNFCLVVECNEINTIVDGGDFYQERDNGGKPALGSLRYLSVHYMKNLQRIWKGPIVSHCLSCLEILALHTCPELTTIFNLELLRNLINLKELIVENCPKVKSLVSADPSGLEADSDFLPALEKILLVDLPELVSVPGSLLVGPKLETIIFSNCPMLKNLSPADMYSKYMHEIKDESEWLKALDGETDYLQSVLVSLTSHDDSKDDSINPPLTVRRQLHFKSFKQSPNLVVLNFFATWCEGSKIMKPFVQAMRSKYTDVDFIDINLDESPDVVQMYSVQGVPTYVLIKQEKVVDMVLGANMEDLKKKVVKHREMPKFAA
ncbi:hypothetical protein LguiA_026186 [Lonicera macranthoides]